MNQTDKVSFSDKVNQIFVQTLYHNPVYSEAINKVIASKVDSNTLEENKDKTKYTADREL